MLTRPKAIRSRLRPKRHPQVRRPASFLALWALLAIALFVVGCAGGSAPTQTDRFTTDTSFPKLNMFEANRKVFADLAERAVASSSVISSRNSSRQQIAEAATALKESLAMLDSRPDAFRTVLEPIAGTDTREVIRVDNRRVKEELTALIRLAIDSADVLAEQLTDADRSRARLIASANAAELHVVAERFEFATVKTWSLGSSQWKASRSAKK